MDIDQAREYKLEQDDDAENRTLLLKNLAGVILARAVLDKCDKELRVETLQALPAKLLVDFTQYARQHLPEHAQGIDSQHDFILLDRRVIDSKQAIFADYPDAIVVEHNLMEFLDRELSRIPTHLTGQRGKHRGIDLFGCAEIRHDGAPWLASIMKHWAGLFSLEGTEALPLHLGDYAPWRDDGSEEGTWYREDLLPEIVSLPRAESIASLNAVEALATQLLALDSNHYILHRGI